MQIKFVIPGEPQGKGRPQFSARNGKAFARTPEKTVIYENLVRTEYNQQCPGVRFADDSQLSMRIVAFYSIPKSASKKRRQQMLSGMIRPTKKPDADNVLKVIADSLNTIAYRDDAQIVCTVVEKYYAEQPKVEVEIDGE